MPTYAYACRACGHEFEALQEFSAKPLRKCPECSKLKLERLISGGGGIIFKGDGFYETDYKKPKKGSGDSDGGDKKKGESPKKADSTPSKSDD